MKSWVTFLLSFVFIISGAAQQYPDSLQQSGRDFMRVGDWGNAIMMFNRALQQKPGDISLLNDMAYTYFLQRDFSKALETIKPVISGKDADVKSFQIAGTVYRAIEEIKEARKVYIKGLRKFPQSGVLYSEYGELLWQKKDYSAILQWEKGIETDPNYAGNYYQASRFYYFTTDKIWSLIYGEIFINLESYTERTAEIKNILYDGYKKLFSGSDLLQAYNNRKKNKFEKAFLLTMNSQYSKTTKGINPENIGEIREGFIKNWFAEQAKAFPFRLFDYQNQLLESNMFEAYNQWIFGSAIHPEDYQSWINRHKEAYDTFSHFQRGRVFKLPQGQYYQTR